MIRTSGVSCDGSRRYCQACKSSGAPVRRDQRLPQACVVAVGLLFGLLLAGLSTHLHAHELAAVRGTSRRA
jgi:hypothetical protein